MMQHNANIIKKYLAKNNLREIIMKQFNLEEYLKNPSKKVVTKDGRAVTRILCTNAKGNYPIVALVESRNSIAEQAFSYTKNGKHLDGTICQVDLFFATEKHEGWVNVYRNFDGLMCGSVFATEEDAKCNAKTAIATIKIEWEE